MIRVGQFHLASNLFKISRRKRTFNRSLRTNIHKHRGLHCAMRRCKLAASGSSLLFQQLIHKVPPFLSHLQATIHFPQQEGPVHFSVRAGFGEF